MKQFAIVGCGRIAHKHAQNINKVGRLVAVCDPSLQKAIAFGDIYQAKAYNSIEELLEAEPEVDVVSICSPNGYHAEHIIKALQAEKNVLCEKPLCLTTAAAWQIIETEKFCRKKLFVVKSARYNPLLQELKKLIDNNEFGRLYNVHISCLWCRPDSYYTDWKGKKFPDGGTLYNQFSHYIDAFVWLFGEVIEAKGFSTNVAHASTMEFEDTGVTSLQFESGLLGTFNWSVNSFQKNYEIAFTIVAENATLKLGGEYLNRVEYLNTNSTAVTEALTGKEIAAGSNTYHDKLYEHLLQNLDGGQSSFPDAYEGLKTVSTIEKIYKAVW